MSATRLQSVADAIVATLKAADISLDGSALKVYDYEPKDFDRLPAVAVGGPTSFRRTEPDEAESQLGSADWFLVYRLTIAAPLDDPARGQRGIRAVLGQIISAIDADPTLGGVVEIEAKLTGGEQSFTDDETAPRQLVLYQCDLEAWCLEA